MLARAPGGRASARPPPPQALGTSCRRLRAAPSLIPTICRHSRSSAPKTARAADTSAPAAANPASTPPTDANPTYVDGAPACSALLRSHLLPAAPRATAATLGTSVMATRLRAAVAAAADDVEGPSVLVVGEPGLCKRDIAVQIHDGGQRSRDLPLVCFDCAAEPEALLFGTAGDGGLLACLSGSGGSLLLDNMHAVPDGPFRARLRELLAPRGCPRGVRVLATSEQAAADLKAGTVIKVPPLRARPADIKALASHYLQQHATRTGAKRLDLEAPALRRLLSWSFPYNLEELRTACERVAIEAQATRLADAALIGQPAASPASAALAAPASSCACKSGGKACGGSNACGGTGACCGGSRGATSSSDDAAVVAAPAVLGEAAPQPLSSEALWFLAADQDRGRVNLLDQWPMLRAVLRRGLWTTWLNRYVTPIGFPLLLAALFLGPQDREHNLGLLCVWAIWWPSMFLSYPLFGRWWCSVCPFMLAGEAVQSARKAVPGLPPLLKWPKEAERIGPWALVAMFAGILIWEDGWHLPDTAALTGWLLVLISSGAALFGLIFPRRFWCRHVCPIGGMNGLFAKLSCLEVRSSASVCTSECTTYVCLKGSEELEGCPMNSHSNQLRDNQICVSCGTCIAHCPHENIELRLRPPGADLWSASHQPSMAEASLLFLLMGAVYLHHLPDLLAPLGDGATALLDSQLLYCALAAVVLATPGALVVGAHSALLARASAGSSPLHGSHGWGSFDDNGFPKPSLSFLTLCYSYVPLVWAATLAFYSEALLTQAGLALQVGAGMAALPADGIPAVAAHPAVVPFVQGSVLLLGTACSLALMLGLSSSRRRTANLTWAHSLVLLAAAASLWGVVLP